ncbi:MAG: hypothetical protein PHI12_12345 [Dehalococcoidales bacterium]|jgi:steroid 5-alpha reductase family enzyme|nr:hypothetical protein [Dehalococcoidales bacterium]
MNIDKRYIEVLADHAPYKNNKWYGRLAILSFFIILIGLFFLSNAINQPIINTEADKQAALTMMYAGMGVAAVGTVLIGVATVLKTKEKKRNRRDFLDYYERYDAFPPWPEEIKPARGVSYKE